MRVSMDEYLRTSYGSATEYINGEAVTTDGSPVTVLGIGVDPADSAEYHAFWISALSRLAASAEEWEVEVGTRPKIEVLPGLFRRPHLAVSRFDSSTEMEDAPPLLLVQIISNEGFSILAEIVDQYLDAGVSTVWLIDPRTSATRWCTKEGWYRVPAGGRLQVPGSPVYLDIASLRDV